MFVQLVINKKISNNWCHLVILIVSLFTLVFSPLLLAQKSYWIYFNNSSGYYPDSITACKAIHNSAYPLAYVRPVNDVQHGCYRVLENGFIQGYGSVHKRTCPPDSDFDPYIGCILDSDNNGENCNNSDNPINIASGNKFYKVIDYEDENFTVSRFFNSYLGRWSFNYTQNLELKRQPITQSDNTIGYEEGVANIIAYRQDGSRINFTYDESTEGAYASPPNKKERLYLVDSGYIDVMGFSPFYDPDATPLQLIQHTHNFVLSDNTVENYNSSGQLVAIRQNSKTPVFLQYSPHYPGGNWPAEVTVSSYSRSLKLIYDSQFQRIDKILLPDGNTILYRYRTDNPNTTIDDHILLSVVHVNSLDEEKTIYQYHMAYNAGLSIAGIDDENGNRISSVQYDAEGRAISSEKGPLGSGIERTQIEYHSDGTRTVTNALGKQSTYHFTQFNGEYKMTRVEGHPSTNCAGANKAYTYDANGFMASKTDWQGNVTTYVHNDRGQEISRTEASGTPQARTITTEWHSEFNLPVRISESKRETIMIYDGNGRLLSREVSARSGL